MADMGRILPFAFLRRMAWSDGERTGGFEVPMITTPIAILLSSWPGLTRPSTQRRWCADGRVKPGHDDNGWSRWVILRGIWY